MVLVSFLVLVVAIALLVVGLVRQSAAVIWAAIGTSVLSAVLLFLGNRLAGTRAKAPARAPGEVEPAEAEPEPERALVPATEGAAAVTTTLPEGATPWAPPEETREVRVLAYEERVEQEMEERAAAGAAALPISGYEGMSVSAIVAQLSSLSHEELGAVREYEVGHAARKTLLARLDVMMRSAAPAAEEPEEEPAPEPAAVAAEAVAPVEEVEPVAAEQAGAEEAEEEEPIEAPAGEGLIPGFATMKATDAQKALTGLDADGLLTMWEFEASQASRKGVLNRIESLYLKSEDMPIDGYDGAAVSAIKPLLGELLPPELKAVRAYEASHGNRKSILTEIDKLLARAEK